MYTLLRAVAVACLFLLFSLSTFAQTVQSTPPQLVRVSGSVTDETVRRSGTAQVLFALYAAQDSPAPLWTEAQSVRIDVTGRFSALLGVNTAEGVPVALFADGNARWLGITIDGREQPRMQLVSVPYALKAVEADTLNGLTAAQISQAVLLGIQNSGSAVRPMSTTVSGLISPNSAPISTATNFTDTTADQVILVTQNGTGKAISATNNGNVATIFGQNNATSGSAAYGVWGLTSSSNGVGVRGQATSTAGVNIGIWGISAGPGGTGILGEANDTTSLNYGLRGKTLSSAGIGLQGQANSATGATTGVRATVASPSGTAMLLDGVGGTLLTARTSFVNKFAVDGSGNITASGGLVAGGNISTPGNVNAANGYCIGANCINSWGTVTSVAAGSGLTASPSPITGSGTLSFDTTFGDARYAQPIVANSFTAPQSFSSSSAPAISATTSYVTNGGAAISGTNTGYDGYYNAFGGRFSATGDKAIGVGGFVSTTNSLSSATGAVGQSSAGYGTGVYGVANGINGTGVWGLADSLSGSTLGGRFDNYSTSGIGVKGYGMASTGANYGGYFQSDSTSGTAMKAIETSTSGTTYAGNFSNSSPDGMAVYAFNHATTGSAVGVYGQSNSSTGFSVYGYGANGSGKNYAIYGATQSPTGYGGGFMGALGGTSLAAFDNTASEIFSVKTSGAVGIGTTSPGTYSKLNVVGGAVAIGSSPQSADAALHITAAFGCCGRLTQMTRTGASLAAINLMASTDGTSTQQFWSWGVDTDGQWKIQPGIVFGGTGLTLDSSGNLHVAGTLTAPTKNFKIDDPLDPQNKYLYHASIESSEMINVYSGNVILDRKGEGWVQLPDWFEALNRDFRYQLTAIGVPGPNLYVAKKVEKNRFKIAGGKPGSEVSWQVTGLRHDAYAQAHPIQVEQSKPEAERGSYLNPDAFGQPAGEGAQRGSAPLTVATTAKR